MEVINTGSGEGLGTRLLGPEKVFLVTYFTSLLLFRFPSDSEGLPEMWFCIWLEAGV